MTEEAPKKRPVGRPSKYKPEYCERILEMAAEGASMAEYAAEFGIDRTTLFDWRDQHEEFSTALARAKILEQAWFEREARMNMKNKEFNANLWYRSALSRFRDDYAEKRITEVSGPDGGAIKTETVAKIDTRTLDESQRELLRAALTSAVSDK
jgi:transposase-like protein